MKNIISLSIVLLLVATAPPAHAADWNWATLKKMAKEYRVKAEKKVDEFVQLAREKWAEFSGQPTSEVKAAKEPPKPKATPQQMQAIGAPIPKQEKAELKQLIEETRKEITSKTPITVAKPGRAGTSVLPKSKRGVPRFDLVKTEKRKSKDGKTKTVRIAVKEIPRLDIGEERTISKTDLIPSKLMVGQGQIEKPNALPTPQSVAKKIIDEWTQKKLPVVTEWKGLDRSKFGASEIVTQKRVDGVDLTMKPLSMQPERPVTEVTTNDLRMLGATILNKKGDKCHLVAGLYHELSRDNRHAEEANFNLGICADKMGFNSEAVRRLLRVVKGENPDYAPEAIANLVEDLPREFDREVSDALRNLRNKNLIPDAAKDAVAYVMARSAHKRNRYAEATTHAASVRESSRLYPNARYMYAIGLYGQKKVREAEKALQELREWMQKNNKSDKNLETLIAVNMARMLFNQRRYQPAHAEYMKVAKDHPVWVQALVEQGWAQLFIDDAAGAIGNMYSLHSPYFKSIFQPESWVVRTIGYIDICQYGDAYRTLSKLEQMHKSQLQDVKAYRNVRKKPSEYYETVRNYIRGRSDQAVDGLPAQVIREIARQRGFLNEQESINNKEDEIAQYKFIYGLIGKDQAALKRRLQMAKERLTQLKANLKKAKEDKALAKNVNEWRAQARNESRIIQNYQFQIGLLEQGRRGYVKLRNEAFPRLEAEKSKLRTAAGRELIAHLKDTQSKLEEILEGNEFLRYEIFAGSGENIRYQVAGGATSEAQRIPANVKPQKILNWEFDGEYWEDEIGSYRSTLQNNCPKSRRAAYAPDNKKSAQFSKKD